MEMDVAILDVDERGRGLIRLGPCSRRVSRFWGGPQKDETSKGGRPSARGGDWRSTTIACMDADPSDMKFDVFARQIWSY